MSDQPQDETRDGLSIRQVTLENWRDTLRLAVHPEQQRFIAEAVPIASIALAKAYIRSGGLLWLPYAFYAKTQMIGFTELAYEPDSTDNYWIYYFFIDLSYQGQGYGKLALRLLVDFIKQQHVRCRSICLTVHPDNVRAQRLYDSGGFQATGGSLEGEPIYRLVVRL